jgi:hypothetical protein
LYGWLDGQNFKQGEFLSSLGGVAAEDDVHDIRRVLKTL